MTHLHIAYEKAYWDRFNNRDLTVLHQIRRHLQLAHRLGHREAAIIHITT